MMRKILCFLIILSFLPYCAKRPSAEIISPGLKIDTDTEGNSVLLFSGGLKNTDSRRALTGLQALLIFSCSVESRAPVSAEFSLTAVLPLETALLELASPVKAEEIRKLEEDLSLPAEYLSSGNTLFPMDPACVKMKVLNFASVPVTRLAEDRINEKK